MNTSNLDIKINIKRNREHTEIYYSQELYNSKYTLSLQADAVANAIAALVKNAIIELSEDIFNSNDIIEY